MITNETVWCDGCGTEIFCCPVITPQGEFCCIDCSLGLSCVCGDRMEWEDDYSSTLSSLIEKIIR